MSLGEAIEAIDKIANKIPAIIIIHELENMTLEYMSPLGLSILKTTKEELIGMGVNEYHNRYFNPDDASDYSVKLISLLENGNENELVSFFQQVRASVHDDYKWYLSTIKIFMKGSNGKPSHLITFATPIDPTHLLLLK